MGVIKGGGQHIKRAKNDSMLSFNTFTVAKEKGGLSEDYQEYQELMK